ncbi:MAG TPA: aldehyde dehydrogenase family protein, partial [bacterium]|nr:aldehyde dehydrogenase family protein [bacterium]
MATTLTKTETYSNYINGEWVPAQSGDTFENRNPADDTDVIGTFPASDKRDLEAAIQAAAAAADMWRLTPAPRRGEILFRAAQLLEERKEEYARLMTREMGKVLKETRGDVQEAIDCAYYYAGEGRRLWGHTTPSELPNKFAMYVRQPVGLCALITPWNFPMAIPSWKIFPALIAGNTAVIKPATLTPLSVVNLIQTLHDAGVPKGVINLVTGPGAKVGDAMVEHPKFRLVSFTGSSEVGTQIAAEAGKRLKKVSLEMGGKNPIVVMDDAKLDL